MIGQTISHYKVLEKLGEGGMGVVYKAEDTKLHRPVALKVLPRQALITEEDKTRFVREAQAAASLNHPNIATIYEFDEVDEPMTGGKLAFIAMEYVDGETVKKKVQERPLPIPEAVNIAIAVAEGLAKAHEKGIIHRDIKSDNVMASRDGVVKIMDFGLAEIAGRTRVTKEGMTVGTVAYMSPEQALGEKLDQRTDIWSLGFVLYEMITGRLPFAGDYEQAIVYRIMNEEPEPITSLRSIVPMELERIVKKAMEKDRSTRYQTAGDLLADLRKLLKGLESGITIEAPMKRARPQRRRMYLYGGLVAFAAVVVITVVFIVPRPAEVIDSIAVLPLDKGSSLPSIEKPKTEPLPKWQNSIAVLPFKNISADKEQEYFCDGMTEQLITNLTNLPNVKVIARTSVMQFKNTDKTVPQIAKELSVAHVLEGSVRRSGNKIRVTAQLVKADGGFHLWAKNYDRELKDVFDVQDDVSNAIVDALKITLPKERSSVTKRYTQNTNAYQLYLKGRYHWNKRTKEGFEIAIEYFNEAIQRESMYALAFVGLANCYNLLSDYVVRPSREAFPKAKEAATKALKIDETLGEAHISLAYARFRFDWDWQGAEEEFKRGLELSPNYSTGHHWYAEYLALMGRFDEALAEITKAQVLDPLSLIINADEGWFLYLAHRSDRAIEQLQRTLKLDEHFAIAHFYLGEALEQKGMYEEAEKEFQRVVELAGGGLGMMGLTHVYAVSGKRIEALMALDKFKQASPPPTRVAIIYAALGEREQAFTWLEKGYEERDDGIVYLKIHPFFDSIRSDPRFSKLLKKVGLEK